MSQVAEIQDADFDAILQSQSLVVVHFTATWCGPCSLIAPDLERLSEEHSHDVKFVKIDIDKNTITPTTFSVRSIPTILIFLNGELIESIIGLTTYEKLNNTISQYL